MFFLQVAKFVRPLLHCSSLDNFLTPNIIGLAVNLCKGHNFLKQVPEYLQDFKSKKTFWLSKASSPLTGE